MVTKKSSKKSTKTALKKVTSAKKTAGYKTSASDRVVNDGKACAILHYFVPIGQIWYAVDENMRKNEFAKFHFKQSLILIAAYIGIHIIAAISPFFWWIGNIFLLVLWIAGVVYSASGKYSELPLVGQLAKNFNF